MTNYLQHISSSSNKLLSIIIVNWNSGNLLENCINSIDSSSIDKDKIEVFVVDNNSSDDSVSFQFPHYCNVIINKENIGFGHACNIAYKECDSDFILLLNPDAQVSENVISYSLDFALKNPAYSIFGVQQRDENNDILRTCGRFPTLTTFFLDALGVSKSFPQYFTSAPLMAEWDHRSDRVVDHVMGSYMLIRKADINEPFLFDDDFFMYYEDLDLSYRMMMRGKLSYFIAGLNVFHECGGTSKKVKAKRLYYSLFSKLLFQKKHSKPFVYFLSILMVFVLEFPARFFYTIFRFDMSEMIEFFQGYSMLVRRFFKLKIF